ncbi:tetratricopeptide repeat protein [Bradyrhizobium sp. McL0615]|uniref:tetratricopeptide repeat protein n=1 Tax=Bradyrhizobium sp. McL0615 TaxID=3415673 RepID=UPI003CEFF4EF
MIGRLALVAFALALASPALATESIGAAGSFRSVGWAQCRAPYAEWKQGACDPAPVDVALPGPALARAHIERSVALLAQTRTEEALKAANAAVAIDPTSVSSLTFRGRLLSTLLKLDAAERDLNAALLIEPTNPVLLASRAEVLLHADKGLDALADITAAVAQRPDDTDMLLIKARIHMSRDQVDLAARDLERAVSLDPSDRRTRLMKAQAQFRLGKFAGAVDDATKTLAISAGDLMARETRALALIALDRPAEAIEDLNAFLGPPGQPTTVVALRHYREILLQRSLLLAQLGKREDSSRDIEVLMLSGGKQAILRVQLYLRRNGFPEVRIDGERDTDFDNTLRNCVLDRACGRGITRHI